MKFERASGILLHPTSLPGPYGIGDLGPEVFHWLDFLAKTGCTLWQVLPLGPTGYGDSPYQCFSAFAGNPYLISPDLLVDEGLLDPTNLDEVPNFPVEEVDYGAVIGWKLDLLNRAFERFKSSAPAAYRQGFDKFVEKNQDWLLDYSLFMALKDSNGGAPWPSWKKPLRDRQPAALEKAQKDYAEAILKHNFLQYEFFRQWQGVREYAQKKNIKIIGDIPIFVAHDSAEVWAQRDLFFMDARGKPTVVAGVPPDYFSPTGQLWGNPLYRWEEHQRNGYRWWISRFKAVLELVDIVRLDHFRGFAGYWEVPAKEKTAVKGRWVAGPGKEFLLVLQKALGDLPIIAEDLGEITPDVIEMRDDLGLPGMKILVFAFSDDATNEFLPHNYIPNCVVYTGTHDNDTVVGWYQRVEEKERDYARRYLARDGQDIAWDLIRAGWSSVASIAIAQLQDVLVLDNRARMNYPSRPSGNWKWRMRPGAITDWHVERLAEFNLIYGRGTPASEETKVGPGEVDELAGENASG
jgi:4-alpha-glucanotransferase